MLLAMLSEAGYQPHYRTTDERWQELLQSPVALVVAVGGDGTVGKVARALVGRELPFSVLPVGTANNVAKTLGITGDARTVVAHWRAARPRPFDVWSVGSADGKTTFIESFGGGFLGQPIATADELHPPTLILGGAIDRALYLLRQAISEAPDQEWQIELDGEDLSGRYIGVEAMNNRSVGPNLPMAPDADLGDGQIDLVLVSDADRDELRQRLDSVATAQTPRRMRLPVRRGRSLHLVAPAGIPYHLDGDPWMPWAGPHPPSRRELHVELAGRARVLAGPGP
jgi:diacylglycerol kinase family enzyme